MLIIQITRNQQPKGTRGGVDMDKPIFINPDEILLVMCTNENENTARSGPFYDETEVLNFLSGIEDVERIIRVELSTN
ncbi:hypothetical protein O99_00445 [Bartonella rochalimae ATCC BAA-1498]|uniref:Uncharacterized protein n=2 Tax=Bartonella rochalimae ATCC BAA-1498 TaxID=685782 RepID=A0A067WJU4_9HYPH|nr:hypothetical protein O99_00445 [Bartonella rochalimae ATCC BAA-1498]